MNLEQLKKDGFTIFKFHKPEGIFEIQDMIKNYFKADPTQIHTQDMTQSDHIANLKNLIDQLTESKIVIKLFSDNLEQFISIVGPDIDIQSSPYVRISRPELEEDVIGWHRDTFYGNAPEEMNIWFPVFELKNQSGLQIIPGSHQIIPKNVHHVVDSNEFKKNITKGSDASRVGYQYAPKTEDLIENINKYEKVLLAPNVGEGIFFFGCCVHKPMNRSPITRVSVDFRIKNHSVQTQTKPGYYLPVRTGIITECVKNFSQP